MKPYNTGTRMAYGRQPSLFDQQVRPTDPVTSHLGAEHVKSKLSKSQEMMRRAFASGVMTAEEAAVWCYMRDRSTAQQTYRKRKNELEKLGVIRFVRIKECQITGGKAQAFEAVK